MSTYVIGDIQGCYTEFQQLLQQVSFDPQQDRIWLAGDVINRGSESLATVQWVRQHTQTHSMVLGNHELHLLNCFYSKKPPRPQDTFSDILAAPECEEICHWLTQQPFVQREGNALLVHAGLYPEWSLEQSEDYAQQLQTLLQRDPREFSKVWQRIREADGKTWSEVQGDVELRRSFQLSVFTLMRYLDARGALRMGNTNPPPQEGLQPWYAGFSQTQETAIYFGHWAALQGKSNHPRCINLDTGCAWGRELTAECMKTGKRWAVPAVFKTKAEPI